VLILDTCIRHEPATPSIKKFSVGIDQSLLGEIKKRYAFGAELGKLSVARA